MQAIAIGGLRGPGLWAFGDDRVRASPAVCVSILTRQFVPAEFPVAYDRGAGEPQEEVEYLLQGRIGARNFPVALLFLREPVS